MRMLMSQHGNPPLLSCRWNWFVVEGSLLLFVSPDLRSPSFANEHEK